MKIFRYFPRQFQARVRALEDAAYPLRKTSTPKYKTEVVYTDSDVQLMVCPQGGVYYQPYHVPHLPPIDTTPARSPPQGRPRPKRGRSANSDSGSPSDGRKSSRHISPPKLASEKGDNLDNIETEVDKTTDDTTHPEDRAGVVSTETGGQNTPVPVLERDLGGYSNIQIFSPRTGKVSFDFKEPVNLRRQSLNI